MNDLLYMQTRTGCPSYGHGCVLEVAQQPHVQFLYETGFSAKPCGNIYTLEEYLKDFMKWNCFENFMTSFVHLLCDNWLFYGK